MKTLELSFPASSIYLDPVASAVFKCYNAGIDAHLTAFVDSYHEMRIDGRLFINIAERELPILIRRLSEHLETIDGDAWSDVYTFVEELKECKPQQ